MSLDVEGNGCECEYEGCTVFDWLPWYCGDCGGRFCSDHRRAVQHSCSGGCEGGSGNADTSATEVREVNEHTMGDTSPPPPVVCEVCGAEHCLLHRLYPTLQKEIDAERAAQLANRRHDVTNPNSSASNASQKSLASSAMSASSSAPWQIGRLGKSIRGTGGGPTATVSAGGVSAVLILATPAAASSMQGGGQWTLQRARFSVGVSVGFATDAIAHLVESIEGGKSDQTNTPSQPRHQRKCRPYMVRLHALHAAVPCVAPDKEFGTTKTFSSADCSRNNNTDTGSVLEWRPIEAMGSSSNYLVDHIQGVVGTSSSSASATAAGRGSAGAGASSSPILLLAQVLKMSPNSAMSNTKENTDGGVHCIGPTLVVIRRTLSDLLSVKAVSTSKSLQSLNQSDQPHEGDAIGSGEQWRLLPFPTDIFSDQSQCETLVPSRALTEMARTALTSLDLIAAAAATTQGAATSSAAATTAAAGNGSCRSEVLHTATTSAVVGKKTERSSESAALLFFDDGARPVFPRMLADFEASGLLAPRMKPLGSAETAKSTGASPTHRVVVGVQHLRVGQGISKGGGCGGSHSDVSEKTARGSSFSRAFFDDWKRGKWGCVALDTRWPAGKQLDRCATEFLGEAATRTLLSLSSAKPPQSGGASTACTLSLFVIRTGLQEAPPLLPNPIPLVLNGAFAEGISAAGSVGEGHTIGEVPPLESGDVLLLVEHPRHIDRSISSIPTSPTPTPPSTETPSEPPLANVCVQWPLSLRVLLDGALLPSKNTLEPKTNIRFKKDCVLM